MVRPGLKYKISIFSLAIVAESMKMSGRSQYGAEYVFGVLSPMLQDAISQVSDEEYQEIMRLINLAGRRVSTWAIRNLADVKISIFNLIRRN